MTASAAAGLPPSILGVEVAVELEFLPEGWPAERAVTLEHDASASTLTVRTVARFTVLAGDGGVRITTARDADPDMIHGWLFGTVAALVLARRAQFALHATSLEVHGHGLAIAGVSGAGKSTTSLRLWQRGHRLVADDVSPIRFEDRLAVVHPFGRPPHVWPQTAAALGLDVSQAHPLWPGTDKLGLAAPDAGPTQIRAVVVLQLDEVAAAPAMKQVRGAEAVAAIAANVYRCEQLLPQWPGELLGWSTALARDIPVHLCRRPIDGWSLEGVVELVEDLASSLPTAGKGG